MSRYIFPKTRWLLGFSGILAGSLYHLLNSQAQNPILITGLVIDIFGATVLAIPDIPLFSSPFKHDLMNKSQDKLLGLSEIHRDKNPEIFSYLTTVLLDIPRNDIDSGYEEDFTNETADTATQLAVGTYGSIGINIYDSSSAKMGVWDFGDVLALLNEEIRTLEGRVRRSGISIIAFGFLLQIASTLL